VIVEGEVAVQAGGAARQMARLAAFIGDRAHRSAASATVTALETAELLRIDRRTLSRVLENHGDVLRAVLRFVRDRLVDLDADSRCSGRSTGATCRARGTLRSSREIDPGTRYSPQAFVRRVAASCSPGSSSSSATRSRSRRWAGDPIGGPRCSRRRVQERRLSAELALCFRDGLPQMIATHPHVLEYIEHAEHSRRLQIL
jgi:CRP-like cAMP-binding protein